MKCPNPKCGKDTYHVSRTEATEISENGNEKVYQFRKCGSCGYTGRTIKQVWVCELGGCLEN